MKSAIAVLATDPSPIIEGRHRISFDMDWRFEQRQIDQAAELDFDDSRWRQVHLPHDWSIEGTCRQDHPTGPEGGFFPAGIGWYRKAFDTPAIEPGQRVFLELDGAMMVSDVYLNGVRVGGRVNGWLSVICDLTDHWLRGRNVLAVRVDNQAQPAARWYTGSGIYRHTWLTITGGVYVPHEQAFVRCTDNSVQKSQVVATIPWRNTFIDDRLIHVTAILRDPEGRICGQRPIDVTLGALSTAETTHRFDVSQPRLWSDQSPQLYDLEIFAKDIHGRLSDHLNIPVGIRWMRWDAQQGFFLNDQPLKLRGVCNHEDLGPLGVALNDKVLESRLRQLKQMGCNAIRTSHHPFSPTFYDLCDRLGMLVMDECFDGWHAKAKADYGARFFAEHWRRDVADWVRRDRNHPCVILWSIGNETGLEDVHHIRQLIHQLDPTRSVTGGEVHDLVDVSGWNGHAEPIRFSEFWLKQMPLVLTEVPHTFQTRGFYRTLTWWRDRGNPRHSLPDLTDRELFADDFAAEHPHTLTYNSSYDNSGVRISARQSWQRTRDHAWISGEFRWTGHDYLGESFGWPLRMGNFGIIDLCQFPKDHYYFYQSQWTDAPMVHLLPHWTHPTLEIGTLIPVWAYSNCDEVELFFQDVSLGVVRPGRPWDQMACQWMVPWRPGQLKAIGRRGGHEVTQVVVSTAQVPAALKLDSDTASLSRQVSGMAQVAVALVDRHGLLVPYGDNRVFFALQGPARLRAADNGDPANLDLVTGSDCRAFQGLCKAYVQPLGLAGDVTLWAAAILGDRSVTLDSHATIDVQRLTLRGQSSVLPYQVRYTLNGRDPAIQGHPYMEPIRVSPNDRILAAVICEDQVVLRLVETFDKTTPILRAVRHAEPSKDLPHWPTLVGFWTTAENTAPAIRLWPDGNVTQFLNDRHESIGTWWYDPPADPFEDAGMDSDHGQIRWFKQDAEELRLMSDGRLRLRRLDQERFLQHDLCESPSCP